MLEDVAVRQTPLLSDAQRRKFDCIAVFKFDRFARSVSHLLRALETFKALGIEFVSLSEEMDTSTPTGKMVFTVLGAVAELERSLIAERVRAGIRNAQAKGKRIGRPPLRQFSPKEILDIQMARRGEHMSVRQLAKQFGTTQWMINRVAPV
jgi:DNA invertase Pin-like site-specific DNA recombinase